MSSVTRIATLVNYKSLWQFFEEFSINKQNFESTLANCSTWSNCKIILANL